MYQVITGVGLPVTSHTKLECWPKTTDRLPGVSLSRKSGGTVEVSEVNVTKTFYYKSTKMTKTAGEQINHR